MDRDSRPQGGGYQFRLCPASEPLTEACFQQRPLKFAAPHEHTIIFSDHSVRINATVVSEGEGGLGWMVNPIPSYQSDYVSCDYVVPPGQHCSFKCPGCGAPTWAADGACPCKCAEQYPGIPSYVAADPQASRHHSAARLGRPLPTCSMACESHL